MPGEVKKLYSKHNDGQSSPSLDEYSKVLLYLSNHFRKSFIIVDALDEHLNEEEGDHASQMELFHRLQEFQRQSNATTCCRLFLTSRENLRIRDQLTGYTHIGIRAMDSDIISYLRSRIFDRTKFRFADKLRSTADLANMITEKLVQAAQGMSVSPDINKFSSIFC